MIDLIDCLDTVDTDEAFLVTFVDCLLGMLDTVDALLGIVEMVDIFLSPCTGQLLCVPYTVFYIMFKRKGYDRK